MLYPARPTWHPPGTGHTQVIFSWGMKLPPTPIDLSLLQSPSNKNRLLHLWDFYTFISLQISRWSSINGPTGAHPIDMAPCFLACAPRAIPPLSTGGIYPPPHHHFSRPSPSINQGNNTTMGFGSLVSTVGSTCRSGQIVKSRLQTKTKNPNFQHRLFSYANFRVLMAI